MTTVSSIIKDALRETNLIGINATPTSAEYSEGLSRLQNIVSSVFGNEAGEGLSPLSLNLNCYNYIPSNSRVMLSQTAVETQNFPDSPEDGARLGVVDVAQNLSTYPLTLDGNGRTIEGAASVSLDTDGLTREWFYRADLGDWTRVQDLTLDGEMFFPKEFDDMFIVLLAMRLNPRYGKTLDPYSIEIFKRNRAQFRARYRQSPDIRSEIGLLRLTTDRYYPYLDEIFETGRPAWNP